MAEVTLKTQYNIVGIVPVAVSFNKAAQNDVITITNIPGIYPPKIVVNGADETWTYSTVTLSAAPTAGANAAVITTNATDFAALPVGAYLQNLTSGEIFVILQKVNSGSTYTFYCTRGLFGTEVTALAASDSIAIMNQIKLTSEETGYGILEAIPYPDPGIAQALNYMQ